MFHPVFKLVKKTYIALIMLSIVHYIPAQVPETASLPGVNQVECSLGMWIEKVVGNQKAWKVVISGKEIMWIDVKGFDFTPSEPYEWGLGSGSGPGYHNRWILQSATSLADKGFIPQYALPVLNDEFGSTNGTIRLKDKYNNPVYSTDLRPNKKAQVFFLKDEPNFWHPEEPNWSYYWKQIVDKKKISSLKYLTLSEIIKVCKKDVIACVQAKGDRSCVYRQLISEKPGYTNNVGIHAFVEILAHENHHITLAEYFWPNGYNPDNSGCNNETDGPYSDCDKDYYPKWFEISDDGKLYKFDPYNDVDRYEQKKDGSPYWRSNGYRYEEDKCLEIQKKAKVNVYDTEDWSFDLNNIFQGKQWK